MLTQEETLLLQELSTTLHGKVLKKYLDEKLSELNDVTACTSWDDTLGRKHAVLLIKDLFAALRKQQVHEKARNQYE